MGSSRHRVVNMNGLICTATLCYPALGGILVNKDEAGHMTQAFAQTMEPQLLRALAPLLPTPRTATRFAAVPASASAASLSLSTPASRTFGTKGRASVAVTVAGAAADVGEFWLYIDGRGRCDPTLAKEQKQARRRSLTTDVYFNVRPGPISKQVRLEVRHLEDTTKARVCGYLLTAEQEFDTAPAAVVRSGRFTLRRKRSG